MLSSPSSGPRPPTSSIPVAGPSHRTTEGWSTGLGDGSRCGDDPSHHERLIGWPKADLLQRDGVRKLKGMGHVESCRDLRFEKLHEGAPGTIGRGAEDANVHRIVAHPASEKSGRVTSRMSYPLFIRSLKPSWRSTLNK